MDDRFVNTPYGKMRRDDWFELQTKRALKALEKRSRQLPEVADIPEEAAALGISALTEDIIRKNVGEGWTDEEIIDVLDRMWDAMGHLQGGPGPKTPRSHGPMPLRVRHLVEARLAALHADTPKPRPTSTIVVSGGRLKSIVPLTPDTRPASIRSANMEADLAFAMGAKSPKDHAEPSVPPGFRRRPEGWRDGDINEASFADLDDAGQEAFKKMWAERDVAPRANPPTAYAKTKIAQWPAAKAALIDRDERINISTAATELNVDRDTLAAWIKRGWLVL